MMEIVSWLWREAGKVLRWKLAMTEIVSWLWREAGKVSRWK